MDWTLTVLLAMGSPQTQYVIEPIAVYASLVDCRAAGESWLLRARAWAERSGLADPEVVPLYRCALKSADAKR